VSDFDIRINGLREVQKALYSYSEKLGDKVVIGSLKQGARVVSREAKKRAPKKTGRLRKAIVVKASKINSRRRKGNKIGVYLTIRGGKGKNDPKDGYYGRWQEDGWNTHGKSSGSRAKIRSFFGRKTGRKTAPGKTDVPGKKFIKGAFKTQKGNAVRLIVASAERGAEVIAKRLQLHD